MEFLLYFVCKSVCALLKNLGDLELLCRENPDCDYWNAAIKSDFEKRPTFSVQICHARRQWMYGISRRQGHKTTKLSFDALKSVCKNENFRLEKIAFTTNYCSGQFSSHPQEITEIVKFAVSYCYKSELESAGGLWSFFPVAPSMKVAVVFKDRSFRKINIDARQIGHEDFVRQQIKSIHLKVLHLTVRYCSNSFQLELEQFALTKPFSRLVLPEITGFDFEFFKKMLCKPLLGIAWCSFMAQFRCKWKVVSEFNRENQIFVDEFTVVWGRADGTRVRVEFHPSSRVFVVVLCRDEDLQ